MRFLPKSQVDPILGIPWDCQVTSEDRETPERVEEGHTQNPSEGNKLPWVMTHSMSYADEKEQEFEVWGVKGDDAKVLAFLWRLHDCLPDRGCVIAPVEIIAKWLGRARKTVGKILQRLVGERLISWVSGGFWSYRQRLAREVRWVGLGEAAPEEFTTRDENDRTDWKTLEIIRRLIAKREIAMKKRVHDLAEKGRITEGHFASKYGDRYGAFMCLCPATGQLLKIIAACGDMKDGSQGFPGGTLWDHVSVSLKDRTPTWEEMCWVKGLFFDEEECVVQYHPPKSKYVNQNATVLHMWKPLEAVFPMPPLVCV